MKQIIQKVPFFLATLGPVGYAPAPGTCASALTAFAVYYMPFISLVYSVILVIILSMVSAFVIAHMLASHIDSDPRECVLDEVVGMAWVLVGIPKYVVLYVCAFLLFRLFDITKWAGVGYVERLSGWRGVLLDDIVAAFWARMVLMVCMLYVW